MFYLQSWAPISFLGTKHACALTNLEKIITTSKRCLIPDWLLEIENKKGLSKLI